VKIDRNNSEVTLVENVKSTNVLESRVVACTDMDREFEFKSGQYATAKEFRVDIVEVEGDNLLIRFPPLGKKKTEGHCVEINRNRFLNYLKENSLSLYV